MKTGEYQKWMAYPPDSSEIRYRNSLTLHSLTFCYGFFRRVGGVKQEAIGLIHRTMRKGEEISKRKKGAF